MVKKIHKQTIPILPLRDVVVYPNMVVPLFVGRTKSIKSLEDAMNNPDSPNYEKYVIVLEIPLNSSGKIIGPIKTVYPIKLEGNFLIAKRSAIKAVLESTPFQVPKEIFPNGLILRVVFDPKSNVGVNNG